MKRHQLAARCTLFLCSVIFGGRLLQKKTFLILSAGRLADLPERASALWVDCIQRRGLLVAESQLSRTYLFCLLFEEAA